jgi:hypothetical protein
MTILSSGADVLASLPDLPRWVEARGLLLSRRGYVVDTADGCRMICGRTDRLVVPITVELSPLLETTATREVPDGQILLQDVMLPAARYHLPDWEAEPATLYTLPPDRARSWPLPQWPTAPLSTAQLEAASDLPAALRDMLIDASAHTPVWAASIDGQPMAFAYAAQSTEGWCDVAVATLDQARNRGLARAAAMGLIVDSLLRGLRPVWGAVKSNEPSHALARRLGFDPVDQLWVLTRRE